LFNKNGYTGGSRFSNILWLIYRWSSRSYKWSEAQNLWELPTLSQVFFYFSKLFVW